MGEHKELTCIGCPMGCPIEVELDQGKIVKITGFVCKKGELYAMKEVVDPRRVITSIVPVDGGTVGMVPVKTAGDIPKNRIKDCMEALKGLRVEAPVTSGQVIVANVCGTGIDLIATRTVARR